MKNIYQATIKLYVAIDSFIVFSTDNMNELIVYSHYIPKGVLKLRSGKYVYDNKSTAKEGEERRGTIFIPDIVNTISAIKVKEINSCSILIICDLFMNSESEIIELAFCEEYEQKFIAIAPITKDNRKVSSTSGDRKYYQAFKKNEGVEIYKPLEL